MKNEKQIGVWMDHSEAHLIEVKENKLVSSRIGSEFTPQQRQNALGKNENLMHNKKQHVQAKYYQTIANAIKDKDEVLLFGPTTAKDELRNLLMDDHHFDKVRIEVKHAGKITENQQHAFVREHFKLS